MAIEIKVEKLKTQELSSEDMEEKKPEEKPEVEAKEEKTVEDINELKDDLKEELVKNPNLLKRTLKCLDHYAKMLEEKEDNPEPEIKSLDDIKKIAYS